MSGPHRLSFLFRGIALIALIISPGLANGAVGTASAQSVPTHPAAGLSGSGAARAPVAQPVLSRADVLKHLGIVRPAATDLTALSQQVAQQVRVHGFPGGPAGAKVPAVGGLFENYDMHNAQSTSILTTLDSSDNADFRDVALFADADGREDNVADHAAKVDSFSSASLPSGWTLTRVAASEHTYANGYTETVWYYGDSLGNVYVATAAPGGPITRTVINLPTALNAFGSLNSADQIVITGLGVEPAADLTSFAKVNGSYSFFSGLTGEILYVSFWDTNGGLRSNFNTGQIIQSGVLAFPIADITSPVSAPPGVQSQAGFPVTVGGAFGVGFSVFANVAGLAVDDDGSVYFQQVDLTGFTGANIVKIASRDTPGTGINAWQDRSLATSGFVNLGNTLNPTNGSYGTSSGPATQVNVATNFAGTASTWGNIISLATGPGNILYAALARSFVSTEPASVQATEGMFANPADLGATPSMIVSFADTSGAFDQCSVPAAGAQGTLPVPDGFADVGRAGLTLAPGVNNFRAFVLGAGPDVRGHAVGATLSNTLQIDFQVDPTIYSGLAVDNESKVYVISGATPAGIGLNPSPTRSEILAFPDQQPFDRRADLVDLRGQAVPAPFPPSSNSPSGVGDGQTDRYDYIYLEAPLDQLSLTPVGLTGLASGLLLYLNRTRTDLSRLTELPNGQTQGQNTTNGPIFFDFLDPGHQIAGGDDQQFPFRGDDNDGSGVPPIVAPLNGGFEFNYRQYITGTHSLLFTAWNAFFLNSNGSLSFGQGDTSPTPTVASMLQGAPRLAGAWTRLDTGSHASFNSTLPVQALGFANINHFVVRWINVPETGFEGCNSSNTFSVGLSDAGTGADTNNNKPLNPANPIGNNAVPFDGQQGPTDLHFVQGVNNLQPAGYNPRPAYSGNFCYTYGRMDLIGSTAIGDQALVGAAPGFLPLSSTPGLDLGDVARANDLPFPAPLGVSIGITTPASPYEFFSTGTPNTFIVTGGVTTTVPGTPVFDLRQEGNDPALGTPVNQMDQNRGQVCFFNLAQQTITFGPLANQLLIGTGPFTVTGVLTATATSGLPVTFVSLTPDVCRVSGLNEVLLMVGQCIIRAEQAGNNQFAPALDVDRSFSVLLAEFLPLIVR